jgi:glycosyltransferase involved in cell wall biosynthesis
LLTLSSITFDNSLGSLLPSEGLRVFDAPALGRVPQRQSAVPQEWNTAHNGLPIRESLRKLALNELLNTPEGAPSPFEKSSADEFMAWGREVSPFSTTGLPRFLDAAMQDNPETYREFVLQDASEGRAARRWWRSKKKQLAPEIDLFTMKDLARTQDQLSFIDRGPVATGVDVFGYLSAGVGVGQAARLTADCLRVAGVDVSVAALQRKRSARIDEVRPSIVLEHDVALMCVDAFGFKDQCNRIGAGYFSDRYTIAQWYWELEQVPNYYREPLSLIDEFWAPTRFLYEAMRTVAPDSVRVTHMPLPIRTFTEVAPLEKSALGIDGRFLFYFSFDFLSVMKRKNPEGIINAYLDAFEERDGAALLIKSINGIQRPEELQRLSEATRGRKDVHVVDEFVSPHLSAALMATADCYVSLHRSEGYGLTLAEAMAMGKPVVATGYSGNLDFMNHENSLLIPFSLVPVGDGAEGYPASSMWAEPDHAASVAALQRILQDRTWAKNLGDAGRQHVAREFSFEVVGGRMRERLAEIRKARGNPPAR